MPTLGDLMSVGRSAGGSLRDLAQGASNAAAGQVSMPVDAVAALLRAAGLPVPQDPVGSSEWMARMGLTREPQGKFAGSLGESLGGAVPGLAGMRAGGAAARLVDDALAGKATGLIPAGQR
jgi:hypothetical protein